MHTVDGLLPAEVLRTAAAALRGADGNRSTAERRLREVGGAPYRGTYAQLSDELIPSFYHQAADALSFRPRRSNAERWPAPGG